MRLTFVFRPSSFVGTQLVVHPHPPQLPAAGRGAIIGRARPDLYMEMTSV
jgi:hypothetical protein